MTGLTADEFHALVPIFHTAFEAYMKRRTIDVRYCRRYVSYANSPLPTTEDKLLFILTYLKQNPTQVMHGHLFQMSQSNVRKWVHLLHGALNYALSQQNLLPARTADDLARRLDFIKICFDFRTAFCVSAKFGSYAARNMFP